jgi:hypothetical protein
VREIVQVQHVRTSEPDVGVEGLFDEFFMRIVVVVEDAVMRNKERQLLWVRGVVNEEKLDLGGKVIPHGESVHQLSHCQVWLVYVYSTAEESVAPVSAREAIGISLLMGKMQKRKITTGWIGPDVPSSF